MLSQNQQWSSSGIGRNRNLQQNLHLLMSHSCAQEYSAASLSLGVNFAYWWAATGQFSGLCWFLWQERQFWNLKHLKSGNKNANKQQETRWLLKKPGRMSLRSPETNKFVSFFSSVVLCSAHYYSLNHQGLSEFWPCRYLPKENNIIKPRELAQLSDQWERCKGKCDNGISTQPR